MSGDLQLELLDPNAPISVSDEPTQLSFCNMHVSRAESGSTVLELSTGSSQKPAVPSVGLYSKIYNGLTGTLGVDTT